MLCESGLTYKAIAAKLGLSSESSVKQLIRRTRRGLEAEIAGLEAESAKLRRLVGAKERSQPG
jgi:DNA-directed RNA polymerase specialized sigma24 family protein